MSKLFDQAGKLVAKDGQSVCQNCGHHKSEHGGKGHTGACLRIPQTGYTDSGRRFYLRWKEPTMQQMLEARGL